MLSSREEDAERQKRRVKKKEEEESLGRGQSGEDRLARRHLRHVPGWWGNGNITKKYHLESVFWVQMGFTNGQGNEGRREVPSANLLLSWNIAVYST